MAANQNDKFVEVGGPGSATSLASPGYTIGDSTITVVSTTNWPTATGCVFAMDVIGADGLRVDGTYNVYQGTVATATSITNVSHISGTGTNRNYSAGTTTRVYIVVAGEIQNRLVEGLMAEHNKEDGTHGAVTATSVTTSGAVLTTPKIITSANDTNGNELIKVTATASAVNEITVANAATGNAPVISATGGDTNVDLKFTPKGTGVLHYGNTHFQANTTNTQPSVVMQTGWGFVTGSGTGSAGKTVTFPLTFTSVLNFIISPISAKITSDPTAITDFNIAINGDGVTASFSSLSTSTAAITVTAENGRTLGSGTRYGFSWIAIGTK